MNANILFRKQEWQFPKILIFLGVVLAWNIAPGLAQQPTRPLRQFGIGALISATLSPDSSQLLTGGADGSVRFWSVASGQLLRTLPAHEAGIYSLALSRDGKRLLTGCGDGSAGLWDVASGARLLTINSDVYAVVEVAITPDGKTLLTGNLARVCAWDAADGRLLQTTTIHPSSLKHAAVSSPPGNLSKVFPITTKSFGMESFAFSPDGRQVVTYDDKDRTIACTWNTLTGKRLQTFTGHTASINTVSFSADGKQVLTSDLGKMVYLWDVGTGRLLKTFTSQNTWLDDAVLSPDGKRVAGCHFGGITLWDAATGQVLKEWTGHSDAIYAVSFSADSKRLLTYGMDQTIRLWEAATGQAQNKFTGHIGHISNSNTVAFSHDGTRVLTGHSDNAARLWDARSGQLLRTLTGYAQGVRFAAFSADGKALLTSDGIEARVSDLETGQTLHSNKFTSSGLIVYSMVVSPDGQRVLAACSDNKPRVLDLVSGKLVWTLQAFDGLIHKIAYSADGKRMMVAGMMNYSSYQKSWVRLYDAVSGQAMGYYECGVGYVYSMDLSADGKKLIVVSDDYKVRVFNVWPSSLVKVWSGPIYTGAFAPDGKRVLLGIEGWAAWLWDPDSTQILRTLPHPGSTVAVAFSADGTLALTGCWDGAARLWDVRNAARDWARYR